MIDISIDSRQSITGRDKVLIRVYGKDIGLGNKEWKELGGKIFCSDNAIHDEDYNIIGYGDNFPSWHFTVSIQEE